MWAKPWIHAVSSAKKYGGEPEDYLEIHNLMDSSKAAFPGEGVEIEEYADHD